MQIGLIDVDGHNGFPNLALMKIGAWHREHGDNVAWWNGFLHYDRVYLSKVFTFTQDCDTIINADEIITGGTGYKDYRELPAEVESVRPDYSIYPNYQRALGFLTRGCIRICPWCIVPQKEGNIHPAATWQEIRRPDSRSSSRRRRICGRPVWPPRGFGPTCWSKMLRRPSGGPWHLTRWVSPLLHSPTETMTEGIPLISKNASRNG